MGRQRPRGVNGLTVDFQPRSKCLEPAHHILGIYPRLIWSADDDEVAVPAHDVDKLVNQPGGRSERLVVVLIIVGKRLAYALILLPRMVIRLGRVILTGKKVAVMITGSLADPVVGDYFLAPLGFVVEISNQFLAAEGFSRSRPFAVTPETVWVEAINHLLDQRYHILVVVVLNRDSARKPPDVGGQRKGSSVSAPIPSAIAGFSVISNHCRGPFLVAEIHLRLKIVPLCRRHQRRKQILFRPHLHGIPLGPLRVPPSHTVVMLGHRNQIFGTRLLKEGDHRFWVKMFSVPHRNKIIPLEISTPVFRMMRHHHLIPIHLATVGIGIRRGFVATIPVPGRH